MLPSGFDEIRARMQALGKARPEDDFKPSVPENDIQYWIELGEFRAVQEHEATQNPTAQPLAHWDGMDLVKILVSRGFLQHQGSMTRMVDSAVAEVQHSLTYREYKMRPGGMGPVISQTSGPSGCHGRVG